MKKYIGGLGLVVLLLSACADEDSLELQYVETEIGNERTVGVGVMSGDLEGEFLPIVSLGYDIELANTGNTTIGGTDTSNEKPHEYVDGIMLMLEPHEELQQAVEETIGENIFTEDGRQNAGLGMGRTAAPELKENQDAEYTIDYHLGTEQENPEMIQAPTEEKLEEIHELAKEATLVIYAGEDEVARYNLSDR